MKIWDVEAGKTTQSWRLGPDTISVPDHQVGVVWPNRSDKLILSLSLSGAINYLVQGQQEPRQVLYGHQKSITAFTQLDSPPTLWSGSSDGQVLYWKSPSSESATATPVDGEPHKNYVSALADDTTNSAVLSVGWDDTLRNMDARSGTFTGRTESTDGQPRGVAVLNDTWIAGTHKGVEVFKADGQKASTLSTSFSTTCLASCPKNSYVAVGGDDSKVRIYSLDKGTTLKLQHEIAALTSQPSTLAFSHSGGLLAVGCANGKIIVYDTKSWDASITRWGAHTGRITSLAWRKDDRFAASASLDTNVFVWSVEKPGRRISAANAHKEGASGVRWLDDSTVVSAGADAALKTWTLEGL